MKVALVHDWLNGMRGGEFVLEAIGEIYPDAEIFTLFFDPENLSEKIKSHKINTSFIQNLPLRKKHYRHYLPLFPGAIERFDLKNFDMVISSSHSVAKAAMAGSGKLHICYCHSPMRYVWDRFDDYFPRSEINIFRYQFIRQIASRLRRWDRRTAARVDLFVANSSFVKWRINEYYNRPAVVLHPPVDTRFYTPAAEDKGDYFLTAGALVPYKKTELIIEAFRNINEKLVVTGDGPEFKKLVYAAPDNVEFTGWLDREKLRDYYRNCKALIYAGVEDFGIIPVEAQACGKPVIAYGRGGLLDTVIGPSIKNYHDHRGFKSGLFFDEQSPGSISRALEVFQTLEFNSADIAGNAQNFSREIFTSSFQDLISRALDTITNHGKTGFEERMSG